MVGTPAKFRDAFESDEPQSSETIEESLESLVREIVLGTQLQPILFINNVEYGNLRRAGERFPRSMQVIPTSLAPHGKCGPAESLDDFPRSDERWIDTIEFLAAYKRAKACP